MWTSQQLASLIDHTQLSPQATESQILQCCDEAMQYHFKTVCVESQWLSLLVKRLGSSGVLPITVVGFPTGADSSEKKVEETQKAIELGAQEIDMVLNRFWLKEFEYSKIIKECSQVVQAAQGCCVKVILETCELTPTQIAVACGLVKASGAHFVKTSTGFAQSGASVEAVKKMRESVGPSFGVKASGGIRSLITALEMVNAGASRLGTSASVAIVTSQASGAGSY